MAIFRESQYKVVEKRFADIFWSGFHGRKTLSDVVQYFATTYPNADKKTKDTFAQEIVQDCIIMKKVHKRKLDELISHQLSKTDNISKVRTQKRDHNTLQNITKTSIFHADRLDGYAFQEFVAEILKNTGYDDVEVTGKSGDQGGDLLAKKDGKSLVIQAKRYSIDSKVSNSAVQEAYAAKAYYNANIAAVITNTLYTKGAKDLADKTKVILWDRQDLTRLIDKYNEISD